MNRQRTKSPLRKRIGRMLGRDWKQYLALFLLLTLTIGFVSGMFVANDSMEQAAQEAYALYDIEDGHFTLQNEASPALIEAIEEEEIHVVPQYYRDFAEDNDGDGAADATIRVFAMRAELNRACLMEGAFPEAADEIVIDRMHADNAGISVGDVIRLDGTDMTVSGLVAFSDYSTLFEDNGDIMFDALTFNIGAVTAECFAAMDAPEVWQYAFSCNDPPKTEAAQKERAEELAKAIAVAAFFSGMEEGAQPNALEDFVPEYANQAIHFAPDDFGSDKAMGEVLLILFVVVIAFIFAITQSHTITEEAAVIGTLRATGYTRAELLRHYIALPLSVALAAAVAGNVLGYTAFKNVVVGMYYHSYSLPTYVTRWNADAFVKTTVYPVALTAVIIVAVVAWKLRLSPLRFLRGDLDGGGRRKALRLPRRMSFPGRLRLRILLQNLPGYLTLALGVLFVTILLAFALGMPATLSDYQSKVQEYLLADYQYVLRADTDAAGNPVETKNKDAEAYSITQLLTTDGVHVGEEVSVYGYLPDSRYFRVPQDPANQEAVASRAYAEKFGLSIGDAVSLKERFGDDAYEFVISDLYDLPGSIALFLPNDRFNEIFDLDEGSYSGYLSAEPLDDLPEEMVYSVITVEDGLKMARQLDHSMGSYMNYFAAICVAAAALILLLLTKMIMEHNAGAISMMKVLGYSDGEVRRIYVRLTTVVVVIASVVSALLAREVVMAMWRSVMSRLNGWFTFYLGAREYALMILLILAAYAVVSLADLRRIRRIPLAEALKNAE